MNRLLLILTILLAAASTVAAQSVSFRASTESAVAINQQFRLNLALTTDGQRSKDVRLPEIDGINTLYGPTVSSQNVVTVNGVTSATIVYTYILMATEEGTYTIPAASITVGNSEYKSNEVTVKVLPADRAAEAATQSQTQAQNQRASQPSSQGGNIGNNDLFIRAIVSKRSVYENEGFLVTFKLYSLVDVAGFENAKFPEFEGFIAQEIDQPDNKQMVLEHYDGRNYRTVTLKQTVLFPQRSGQITIEAGKFDVVARIRTQQRVRSIFDDWLDSHQNVTKTVTTAPITIDVKALPAGKPASFSGAVGDYKLTSAISTNELKANDAVTVKTSISGTGNIKLIRNPEIKFPNDFDEFDPIVNVTSRASASGVSGTKTIEYNAIPRFAGNFTIPALEFSYFDPKSETYKTLRSEEYTLKVEPGAAGSEQGGTIIASSNKEDIRFLGKDIRYIKTDGFHFSKGNFFFGTLIYWLFYLIPFVLLIALIFIYRKQAAENANIAYVRTKKANKVASKRLKLAAKYLKEDNKEAFYDETLKAVWGYLSDKLNIPQSELNKDNIETNLADYGAGESLIKEFLDILNTAEFARFAPGQEHAAMDTLYNTTVKAIDQMENTARVKN